MIEASRFAFVPIVPGWALWALLAAALFVGVLYAVQRGRAAMTRTGALLLLVLALANPSVVEEEREPLPSVAAVILDRSESMRIGNRSEIAQAAFEAAQAELGSDARIELRVAEVGSTDDGTRLVEALQGLLSDVPRDRVAGAILITDGQVHDVPGNPETLQDLGPIHTVLTGDQDAGDRHITLVEAPNFGIVDETVTFRIRVDDPDGGRIAVSVSVNGGRDQLVFVEAGIEQDVPIEIERRGENIVVFDVPAGAQELTLANNRTAATVSGIRDGLRVLLVTGRPNAAGRVWRDLLKSDPSVDLVHFTILRPPYKNDMTPLEEMALIAFPTEELFEEKLSGFDLVIFDQYERRGVITMAYLSDVAAYVDEGGALMIVAGEDFAGPASLARTPLAGVLPAQPTGSVELGAVRPEISDAGARHTITETLSADEWGPWLRYIGAVARTGDVLLTAPSGDPLLAVDRVGDGRVGLLLSDQIWLWARGYQGGGPFDDLIRRLVHWLMKEPELQERQLRLIPKGDSLEAQMRTLSDTAAPLSIETPSGAFLEPEWDTVSPGRFRAEVPVDELGLYRARSGGLEAVVLNGPANPVEFSALTVTPDVLAPLAAATGGGLVETGSTGRQPDLRIVSRRGVAHGNDWLGLRERGAYAVRSSKITSLLPGLLAVIAALGLLLWAWRRESR